MEIALVNHHTPYVAMLAKALPEHHFHALPTRHAPRGWRFDQRPRPDNVEPWPGEDNEFGVAFDYWESVRGNSGPRAPDVVLLQSAFDVANVPTDVAGGLPWVLLSHNHFQFEAGAGWLPAWLAAHEVPLVCISAMKAASWVDAGYPRAPIVIPPYAPVEEMLPWEGTAEGTAPVVLTVANHLARPLFSLEGWLTATRGHDDGYGSRGVLIGEGNDGITGANGPAPSWPTLRRWYQGAAVYLNPTVPPLEDAYNLALLEARATGMPWVSLHDTPPDEVREVVDAVFRHEFWPDPAAGRALVAQEFPKEPFAAAWRRVLGEVAHG